MREIRTSGSEGGAGLTPPFLPLSGPESIWRGMAKAQAYGEMWLALQGGE